MGTTCLTRRDLLRACAGVAFVGAALPRPLAAGARASRPPELTPEAALARLRAGNLRYVENHAVHPDQTPERRRDLRRAQHPFAAVFGCVDSRVAPELVFDEGLGDLFTIRSAAHLLDTAELASIEFGVLELEIPLIVVLGHERCGAVKAAVDVVTGAHHEPLPGALPILVEALRPVVDTHSRYPGDRYEKTMLAQVARTVDALGRSRVIRDRGVRVVGARYDLDSGEVHWLDVPAAQPPAVTRAVSGAHQPE